MVYLADKVIQYFEDPESFYSWIKLMEKVGAVKHVKIDREKEVVAIQGKVNAGLYRGLDPINALVLLGFAFFGELWVYMPDVDIAFKKIKKWWRGQIKKE